ENLNQTKDLLENLMKLMEAEEEVTEVGEEIPENFMMVDESGKLKNIEYEEIKTNAASTMANKMHEANLTLKQLFYLGMDDNVTLINKGKCSAADILVFSLEKKLALAPGDKDMVVMLHEIEYSVNGKKMILKSSLIVKGENNIHTAMAKTVGLPLGIAAKLIMNGTIKLTGVRIPVSEEIYNPVMNELSAEGISFTETVNDI
ncbi:MAG TPA: saccharopine dehydrogenase C-terminal domain-containing protein, partial [Ferruginibacter sp.]|nr:saccharopine dehydrogenase C-terminal domain-containing protein [Ferruginibacter sp.]